MRRVQKNARLAAAWWAAPLGLVVVLLMAPATPAGAAGTARPPSGSPETKRAIGDIRNAGKAMFSWYTDQQRSAKGKEQGEGHATHAGEAAARVDLGAIPVISYDDLATLLVPRYIQSLPRNDPWGHPYEYRLNTQNLAATQIMAVRSAGADGKFSGDSYEVGAFSPADRDHDLVWSDGYFVAWPEARGK
jgi:Type II secretion system (T2SS), protein G